MPVAIIDIPSGVTTNAKNQLHKDVAESMHPAYQIPDNRVYLREWAAEQTSFDGVVTKWLSRRRFITPCDLMSMAAAYPGRQS